MVHRRELIYLFVVYLAAATAIFGGQTPGNHVHPSLAALSPQEVFKHVAPSVVVVESLDGKRSVNTLGSAIVISPGRVITNRHVIEDGLSFTVENDGHTWPAKLIKVDPNHDLAELAVNGLKAPPVQVRDSSTLAVGEKVYAIGAPEGLELTISGGLISGLRDFDNGRVIQTSAVISPGSSGGGLFDAEGRLVGITTFYVVGGQNLNFALPADWVLALDRQPLNPARPTGENSAAFQSLLWFETGYKADQAGKYDEAASAFRDAVRLKPDLAVAWDYLGAEYNSLGQYGKAASAELHAVRLRPGLEDAWEKLAASFGELRQWSQAAMADQEAVRLKPSDEAAWIGLGEFQSLLGQSADAISAEEEAIRLKPGDENAWSFLGRAYLSVNDYKKAVNAEQQAIRLKPSDALPWFELGTAYLKLRQPEETISAEQVAVRLDPRYADAWFNLGLAFKIEGRQSQVIVVYEKLKTIDSNVAEKFFQLAVLP